MLAVPSGQAVDRFGERRVMLVGAVLVAAAAGAFVLVGGSVAGLVAGSVLLGTGHLCSVVGEQALVANATPAGRHDTAFGYYTFAASLGQALGPGLILLFGGTRTIPDTGAIFVSALGIAAVLFGVTLLLRSSVRTRTASRRHGRRDADAAAAARPAARVDGQLRRARRRRHHAGLPAGPGHRARHRLGRDRGDPDAARRGVDAVAAVPGTAVPPARPQAAARRQRGAVRAGLAVAVVPMPVWALALVAVVLGLGLGAGQPLTMSWLAEATPPGLRGRAMSLRLTGNRVGQVVVPSTAGLLAAGAGAGGVLVLTAAGLVAVGVAARRIESAAPPG